MKLFISAKGEFYLMKKIKLFFLLRKILLYLYKEIGSKITPKKINNYEI